jgi:hypothetical protein
MFITDENQARHNTSQDLVASLRRGIAQFANPVHRYNFQKCNAALSDLQQCCERMSLIQEAGCWQGLSLAIASTAQFLGEAHYDLPRLQHLVNMPERVAWLNLELSAALGDEVSVQALKKHRPLFQELPNGTLRIWQEQARAAGQMHRIGTFRKNIRELRTLLSDYENSCTNLPESQAVDTFRSWIKHAISYRLTVIHSLRQVQRATCLGDSLRNLFDEFTVCAEKLHQGLVRSPSPIETFKSGLAQLCTHIDVLEQESRALFSAAMGFKVSPEHHRQVSVFEITGKPTNSVVEQLRAMMKEWLIDIDDPRPQRGFGRVYTQQEVEDFCDKHHGRLFCVKLGEKIAGFYLIFIEPAHFPPHVHEALAALANFGEYMRASHGWTEMVGITHEGRDCAHQRGIDLYTLIDEAVCDTFATFQREKIFAEVREGTYANLSKPDHLKRGWEESGIIIQSGKFPYQIISRTLSPAGMWGY